MPVHSCIFVPEMGRFLSLLILFCYLYLIVQPAIPILNYLVQKNYYANTLCENKSRPSLKCEGKCALKKQITLLKNQKNQQQSVPIEIEFSTPGPHCPKRFALLDLNFQISPITEINFKAKLPPGYPSQSTQPPENLS